MVDIDRGDLAASPLGAASPAVFQVRSRFVSESHSAPMTQAPQTPRGGHPLVRLPPTLPSARRAFPPNESMYKFYTKREQTRKSVDVVTS